MSSALEPKPQPAAAPELEPGTMFDDDPLIRWEVADNVLTLAADRSLRSALRRLDDALAWVIIVRHDVDGSLYYYAYRALELRDTAAAFPNRLDWPLQQALDLHEWGSSVEGRGRRPSARHILRREFGNRPDRDFDATGRIKTVGNIATGFRIRGRSCCGTLRQGTVIWRASISGHSAAATSGPPAIRANRPRSTSPSRPRPGPRSTSGRSSASIFASSWREAMPLAGVLTGAAVRAKVTPIVVLLSVENDVIEIVGAREITVQPPARGQPAAAISLCRASRPAPRGSQSRSVRAAATWGGSALG